MSADDTPSRTGETGDPKVTGDARAPEPAASGGTPALGQSSAADVADFLKRVQNLAPVAAVGRGRLVFAMDATMSRRPTWDMALALQAQMFETVKSIGGLDVQLVYFRGAGECRASKWVADPEALARLMTTVECRGGFTQIAKVLSHARQETERRKIAALVYIGDSMEEEPDDLCGRAGELALHGAPVFVFQEGIDTTAERTFREIARLTKGAYCRFDQGAADQLRELLAAVAAYAAGGRDALLKLGSATRSRGARLLLEQLQR